MKDILESIGIVSLITACVIGVIFACIVAITSICKGTYKYKDYDGNYGIAEACYTTYGDIYCVEEDGTTLRVVEYRKVK